MIFLFCLFQICISLFAFASAFEEAAFTWPFRELIFNFDVKMKQLKIAHRAGAIGVAILFASMGIVLGHHYQADLEMRFLVAIIATFSYAINYWLVFDIAYAKLIGKDWFYIGETADEDNWLRRILGRYAGEWKAVICVALIIGLNLLFKFFI